MRRSAPTRFSIAQYWHRTEPGWIESLELPHCFACKFDGFGHPVEERRQEAAWNRSKLERAHIAAKSIGGGFDPSNFLLLCPRCHRESPMLSKQAAMLDWAKSREYYPAFLFRRLTEELKQLDFAPEVPIDPAAMLALARHMSLDCHPGADFPAAAWAAVAKEYCELYRIGFRWAPNG